MDLLWWAIFCLLGFGTIAGLAHCSFQIVAYKKSRKRKKELEALSVGE